MKWAIFMLGGGVSFVGGRIHLLGPVGSLGSCSLSLGLLDHRCQPLRARRSASAAEVLDELGEPLVPRDALRGHGPPEPDGVEEGDTAGAQLAVSG